MKANFNKGIIKIMSNNNLGVDVVSKGELKESLKCGVKNKQIVFFVEFWVIYIIF